MTVSTSDHFINELHSDTEGFDQGTFVAGLEGGAVTLRAPEATKELGEITEHASFASGLEGGAEVVVYEDGLFFVTNGALGRIDVFDLVTEQLVDSYDLTFLPGFDGLQSVAVKNGLVAAAVSTPNVTAEGLSTTVTEGQNGYVVLIDVASGQVIDRVTVGNLPDMVTFNADGSKLLVANEGAFNAENGLDRDPIGSVSIIDLANGALDPQETQVSFADFDGLETLAQTNGIRLADGASMLRGLEPEYITVQGNTAYIALQEANAIAVLDIETATFTNIFSAGVVDHSVAGNEIDVNNNGVIDIRTFDNLVGLRMPDAIASFEKDGTTYLITANEGDGRGDAFDEDGNAIPLGDELRVGDAPAGLIDTSVDTTGLERLKISTIDGDTDGDGDIDVLHSFGSRGFTILDTSGNVIFDSGSEFAAIVAEIAPERFNDDDGDDGEDRSDDKGVEPEAVTVGEVNGALYAFIALERDSGIMIYNIDDPANATYVDYIPGFGREGGDVRAPETIAFVPAEESPAGVAQIAVAYEATGDTLVYDLGAVIAEPVAPRISEFRPNPAGSDPNPMDVELTGEPGAEFDLWLLSVESDAGNGGLGTVDRAANVTGSFDANGIAVVQVPDLENPSFTYILADDFTGTQGQTDFDTDNDGVPDDLSTLVQVFDAIGVPDAPGEPLYGAAAGGVDLVSTENGEPELLFRDGQTGDIYRVFGDTILDAQGNEVDVAEFDVDPTAATFGSVNPVRSSPATNPDLQVTEIWPGQEGRDITGDWFEITNLGEAAWTPDVGALFYDDDSDDPSAAASIMGISAIAPGESVIVVTGADASAVDAFKAAWAGSIDGVQVGYVDGADLGGGGDAVTLFLDADGTLTGADIVDVAAYPDAAANDAQSWDVDNGQFSEVGALTDVVESTATGGDTGDTPAVGSPGAVTETIVVDPFTLISAIQGSSANVTQVTVDDGSALAGQVVTISAVVTADFQEGLGGFFVQEEDADQDADATTSEGIFIFDGVLATGVDVSVGDVVTIEGTVAEFFGQTQITAGSIAVTGTGAPLPTATIVNLGSTGAILDTRGDYVVNLEAVEGMLITIPEDLVISEMFNLDRFGQYSVSADGRPVQFTQENAPDAAGFDAHLQDVAARSLVLDDGSTSQNPAELRIIDGNNGVLDATDSFRMGDTLSDVTGVVRFGFDEFRLDNASGTYSATNPRLETPDEVEGAFKAVSLNVLNFFTTIDAPGAVTDTGADPRGADDLAAGEGALAQTEFDRQAAKLVNAIVALDADVLGLVELENSSTDAALAELVDAVNTALGSTVYDYISTGLAGGDAITNGIMYKVDAATPVGDVAVLTDFNGQSFLDPLDAGRDLNRPAVTQTFEEASSGALVTISVNHFKSKGSLSGLPEDEDQLDGAGNNNATREAASTLLAEWLASDPTGTGAENQLIIGDLNAYAKETPITALEDAGFTDVAQAVLGNEAYSYVFDGQIGTLDYIMANGPAFEALTGAAEWHINADEADAIDYNLDFGRDPNLFNGDTPARNSDHDPVVAGFTFEEAGDLNIVVDSGGDDYLEGTAGNDLFALKGGEINILLGLGGDDVFDLSGTLDNGIQDTNRLFDWSEGDLLTGITVDDVDLSTAFSFGIGLRFEYGADNDIMIVNGEDVPDILNGIFGDDFMI
ncbi:MAG: ExeM/NucH family extracellular endonuclease [Roseobacter sp.]